MDQGIGASTDKAGKPVKVAVCIGPEHGTVGPELIKEAAKEAVRGVGFDTLLVAGFAFDPHVGEEAKRYGNLTVLPVRINADIAIEDDDFGEAYRRARRQAFSQAISMSQKFAPVALQALAKIVTDEKQPTSCRVSAASAILKFSRESLELDDLATRLDAVEAQLKGDAPANHTLPPSPIDPQLLAEAA